MIGRFVAVKALTSRSSTIVMLLASDTMSDGAWSTSANYASSVLTLILSLISAIAWTVEAMPEEWTTVQKEPLTHLRLFQ